MLRPMHFAIVTHDALAYSGADWESGGRLRGYGRTAKPEQAPA